MLKVVFSALAAVVMVTALGMSAADAKAKSKKVKAKEATAASCTASTAMRDEARFMHCFPNKR
jgi:outer membrane lipoprotein-sorting protein